MRKLSFALVTLLVFTSTSFATDFVNGQAARAAIGQTNFTYGVSGANQNILGAVGGLAYANGMLFTADSNRMGATPQNSRVLMFHTAAMPGPYVDVGSAPHPNGPCYLCGINADLVVGQQDFVSTTPGRNSVPGIVNSSYAGSLNQATAVATDGTRLAIADTDNNRVLLWYNIPANQSTPPNVVLGQANFTAFQTPQLVNANSLRGPQGVWIQNNKLYVADTQNHRVLIWNSIPTQNNQPADLVLGQPNFTTASAPSPTASFPPTAANRLYNPVSVTSDGIRLFVADLGSHRVLIWNSLPTSNTQPADVVVGQPDMTTAVPNFSNVMCANTSAARCESTLDTPRFALSDGTRLYIADGGNDRVLVFNSIPTANGAKADNVLGQPDFAQDIVTNQASSIASTAIDNTAAVDTLPAPTSLAWDGTNLYVSDPFNRRVLLFTPGDIPVANNAVVNWASEIIRQEGVVVFGVTTIAANDTATITIAGKAYSYTVKSGDTVNSIASGLVSAINANNGDPNVTALLGSGAGTVYLSSKGVNLGFDAISLSASVSNTTNLSVTTSGSYLSAGTAATASPGMLVEINASSSTATLSDQTASIPDPPTTNLPTNLGGVMVFMDGIPQPLVKVSPSQVVALVPWVYGDRNSTSIYVRTQRNDGSTTITNATSAYIAPANPGLFSDSSSGTPPYPAVNARHQPGNPQAVVSVDGTAKAADTATITIAGSRNYTYTVATNDSLASIVTGLVNAINNAGDPDVTASAGAAFNRVVIVARQPGAAGNGISVATSASSNAQVTLTAYTSTTCCAVQANAPITAANPAQPGETIVMSAAGLGTLALSTQPAAGQLYNGTVPNTASNSVSATMGGSTAQVVAAGLSTGSYGKYDVQMIVPTNLASNAATQVYIAQNAFVSNIVTIPVGTSSLSGGSGGGGTVTCTYSLSSVTKNYLAVASSGAIGVSAPTGCSWTASVDQSWVTFTNSTSGTGNNYVTFQLAENTTGADRSAVVTIGGQTTTIVQSGSATPTAAALRFVPITPCRALDTRPSQALLLGGVIRDFPVATSCNIPSTVQAYAMNVTVVPTGTLTYLRLWGSGGGQPYTSTLNSYDGRIKSNATIVPAGTGGSVAALATNDTHLILDITGYFVPASTTGALAFYQVSPCRVMDTRNAAGPLGSPSLSAGQTRTIPVLSATGCSIPSTAQAYSLNVTAIPKAPLLYLTVWPGGQTQPATSTLNAPTGTTVANGAIIPAGASGALSVYSTADADLVVDINGYFAPAGGQGALSLYTGMPCRALDTRIEAYFSPINGNMTSNISNSGCSIPSTAQSFVFNVTAVPTSTLSYLTLWSAAQSQQPTVSTLNAYDGAVTSNLAIVPTSSSGDINIFTTNPSYLIFDLLGYFAP